MQDPVQQRGLKQLDRLICATGAKADGAMDLHALNNMVLAEENCRLPFKTVTAMPVKYLLWLYDDLWPEVKLTFTNWLRQQLLANGNCSAEATFKPCPGETCSAFQQFARAGPPPSNQPKSNNAAAGTGRTRLV